MSGAITEREQWQVICKRLLNCGAVTEEDLQSPVDADRTSGQKLLKDIRQWGELHSQLARGPRESPLGWLEMDRRECGDGSGVISARPGGAESNRSLKYHATPVFRKDGLVWLMI